MADKNRLSSVNDPSGSLINADYASTPRSSFDYSCTHTTTIDMGAIVPIDCFKVLPGDSVKIGTDILLTVSNPLVQRMLTGCRIFTHSYYMRCSDMWLGFENYIDRGASGVLDLTLPSVSLADQAVFDFAFSGNTIRTTSLLTPMSLYRYLGGNPIKFVPSNFRNSASWSDKGSIWNNSMSSWLPYEVRLAANGAWQTAEISDTTIGKKPAAVNALPFFMYQSIYKWYFAPKNLLRSNLNWYPDNTRDWILPYSVTAPVVSAFTSNSSSDIYSPSSEYYSAVPVGVPYNLTNYKVFDSPTLLGLRYRQWRGDEFTAGLPWLERGLPVNIALGHVVDYDNAVVARFTSPMTDSPSDGFRYYGSVAYSLGLSGDDSLTATSISALTMSMLRQLSAWTQFQERNATLDGTYNDFIRSRFNRNPHSRDYRPQYIGGSVQNLVFSEVLQTSEDSNTPLGTQAGRAVSAASNYIGKIDVDDYGYIMTVLEVVPDVHYAQGLPKYLEGGVTSDTEVFPEFVNLPPEPIKKQELFVSGTSSVDQDLFAYRERYGDYKSRSNRVSGLVGLSPEQDNFFAGYTFARWFNESQELNPDFVTMSPRTVRRDMFSVPSQPMFVVQCANRVDMVRPLPRDARTMSLTNQL